MSIKEMLIFLADENISIINKNNLIFEEKSDNGENFYLLEYIDEQWKILFYRRGNTFIKKVFKNREEAIRFFCIFELKQKINREIVMPAIRESDVLYSESVDLNDILHLFAQYNVESQYYNSKEKAKRFVIDLQEISDDCYKVNVLNGNMDCIYCTEEIDRKSAFFVYFKWAYTISLFFLHKDKLCNKNIFLQEIFDSDIVILLSAN